MSDLPTGTVTFLLTDVEGTVRLWEAAPSAMHRALARHDALIEQNVAAHGGKLVRPKGEGDSLFAVFARATDALAASLSVQLALAVEHWPTPTPLKVRMALHTREADLREGDYYGSGARGAWPDCLQARSGRGAGDDGRAGRRVRAGRVGAVVMPGRLRATFRWQKPTALGGLADRSG